MGRINNPVPSALGDVQATSAGVVSWSYNPLLTTTATAATSQTIYAVGVPYRSGQVVTNIGFLLNVAAAGTDPTSIFVGLSSSTAMIVGSADHNASALWDSTGFASFALSSPYTIPSDDIYYHMLLIDGTFSVTQPTFARPTVLVDTVIGSGKPFFATAGTGQTALPAAEAAVTLSASGALSYFSYST